MLNNSNLKYDRFLEHKTNLDHSKYINDIKILKVTLPTFTIYSTYNHTINLVLDTIRVN